MRYLEVKVKAPVPLKDAIINRLMELGAAGIYEAESISGYFDSVEKQHLSTEMDTYRDSLSEIFPSARTLQYEILPVEHTDWSENWKQHYHPQALGSRFYLVPNWQKDLAIPPERKPIYLEPGQAFGTGLHPSTQLCIELMEKLPIGESLFDIGTGTGILAIVGQKLGWTKILANDIDEVALEVAQENLNTNQSESVQLTYAPVSEIQPRFDLVMANILLETHLELIHHYAKLLAPGGKLILSGLLVEQREELLNTAKHAELKEIHSIRKEEWIAILIGKEAPTTE